MAHTTMSFRALNAKCFLQIKPVILFLVNWFKSHLQTGYFFYSAGLSHLQSGYLTGLSHLQSGYSTGLSHLQMGHILPNQLVFATLVKLPSELVAMYSITSEVKKLYNIILLN